MVCCSSAVPMKKHWWTATFRGGSRVVKVDQPVRAFVHSNIQALLFGFCHHGRDDCDDRRATLVASCWRIVRAAVWPSMMSI